MMSLQLGTVPSSSVMFSNDSLIKYGGTNFQYEMDEYLAIGDLDHSSDRTAELRQACCAVGACGNEE